MTAHTLITAEAGNPQQRGETIHFSRPFPAPRTMEHLAAVHASDHAHGDGPFTHSATSKLTGLTGAAFVTLTTSGTHALEMASLLLDLAPGDEVIVPSYTFPSAATAVAMTGAQLVFVDIDERTGNLAPESVESAITSRTRAISVMHYGGSPVDMAIFRSARISDIPVIEDNAHGLGVNTDQGVLGTLGAFGIQSFHDTKNIHAGEGGALLINEPRFIARAEIIREKGTNRSQYLLGQVDKYSWVDRGSSYLPSEYNAAVLDAQLDVYDQIQQRRHTVWDRYARELTVWAAHVGARLMDPPDGVHAAHMFFIIMASEHERQSLLGWTRAQGVMAASHYVPLHSSAAGRRYGRAEGSLERTDRFATGIVRLPLWPGMSEDDVTRVIDAVVSWRDGSERSKAEA